MSDAGYLGQATPTPAGKPSVPLYGSLIGCRGQHSGAFSGKLKGRLRGRPGRVPTHSDFGAEGLRDVGPWSSLPNRRGKERSLRALVARLSLRGMRSEAERPAGVVMCFLPVATGDRYRATIERPPATVARASKRARHGRRRPLAACPAPRPPHPQALTKLEEIINEPDEPDHAALARIQAHGAKTILIAQTRADEPTFATARPTRPRRSLRLS